MLTRFDASRIDALETALKTVGEKLAAVEKAVAADISTSRLDGSIPYEKLSLEGNVRERDLSLSDVTAGDATAERHGFLPKLPDDPKALLDGRGNFIRAIRGQVLSTGSVVSGSDFTVTKGGVGVYTIDFAAFDATPVVLVTAVGVGYADIVANSPTAVTFTMIRAGEPADVGFNFLVLSPA